MLPSTMPAYAETLIRSRRSIRAFLPGQVDEDTMRSVFDLAAAAPSNSNMQPWKVQVVSGGARDRLSRDLLRAHDANDVSLDFPYGGDLHSEVHTRRGFEAGAIMYDALGVERGDSEGRDAANRDSLNFYGAPHVALLFMPKNAEERMSTDTGIYAQTLMLALSAYGIGSCAQGLLGFYADTVRESLGIDDDRLLLGISFGFADTAAPINNIVIPRATLAESVRFRR